MIERLTGVRLEPEDVLGTESTGVIRMLTDVANYGKAVKKRDRPTVWYYHALGFVVLETTFLMSPTTAMDFEACRSCARLIAETIIGHGGTVKTRRYKKEKQVRKRTVSMYNHLARDGSSPLAIARILSTFIMDQYLATIENRTRPLLLGPFRLLR